MMLQRGGQRVFGDGQLDQRVRAGLVGHWIGGGSGRTWFDHSGYGNHATLLPTTPDSNGPTWTLGQGGKRSALQFDGVDDYVVVPDSVTLRGLTGLTISAWVYKRNKDIKIAGKWLGGQNYILREVSGVLQFFTFSGSQVGGNFFGISPATGWNRYTATWDGATMRAYKNGVVSSTTFAQTGTISNTGSALIIGAEYDAADPSDQTTDDVRIYNRALSAAEVALLASPSFAPVVSAPRWIGRRAAAANRRRRLLIGT